MSEFKLMIDRLTEKPQRFEYEASVAWWMSRPGSEDPAGDARFEQPFRFEVSAQRLGAGLLVEGSLEGGISVECSRCTRRYAHALRDSFRLVLEPLGEDPWGNARAQEAIDPEGERAIAENGICLGEDLEAGWFRGPVIFLDDLFAEVVATAMPIQPLCEEECPGLCPHCGEMRGEMRGLERRTERGSGQAGRCGCVDERVPSPFAVLANWKAKPESAPEPKAPRERGSGKARTE
ncbi:MAG: YceD family protein [Myxococcota bacterium]